MSSSYAERKLGEAIAETRGSATATRRLILNWMARDPKLLYELVQPFLNGIVGHAVDRAIRLAPKQRPADPAASLGASALDGVIRALSQNFERTEAPAPAATPEAPAETSAAHADAIRQLARAQVRRRAIASDQLSSARR